MTPPRPTAWDPGTPGVLALPSGRLVRGRSLRVPPTADETPGFGLYLAAHAPPPPAWPARWVRWRDFRPPADTDDARAALLEAWRRAADDRVEVACWGGRGRTGTALACLAVLDGVPADAAVWYVRQHYDRRAAETVFQRRFVARFPAE